MKQECPNSKYGFILLGIILFAMLRMWNPLENEYIKNFCQSNPDQCVCEYYNEDSGARTNARTDFCDETSSLYHLRKKTAEELAIDDCNANPREDEQCMCLNNSSPNFEGWFSEGDEEYWKQRKLECFSSNNVNVRGELMFSCYLRVECLSSHPKTECEKGNPDWVEENLTIYLYEGEEWYVCNDESHINFCVGDACSSLYLTGNSCDTIKNQKTICRERVRD